jgi:hypothetical protein
MQEQRFAFPPHPPGLRRSAGPWLALLAALLALGAAAPARATTTIISTATTTPITINAGDEVDVVSGGSVAVASGVAVTVNGGTLNVEGGSVRSANYRAVYVSGGGTATVSDGGSLWTPDDCLVVDGAGSTAAISGMMTSVYGGNAGVLVSNGGGVTISDGSVQGGGPAVALGFGTATISGGSLSGGYFGVGVSHGGTATITGGSLRGTTFNGLQVAGAGSTATVSGGSLSGGSGDAYIDSGGSLTFVGCDLVFANRTVSGVLQNNNALTQTTIGGGTPALQNSSSGPPTITVPPDVSVNADAGQCTASSVALGTPTTGNVCGTASVTNNAPAAFPIGTTTVTWTVTDTSGNKGTATQKVTVTENVPPTITAPPDVTVNADAGQCTASNVALGTPTTGDNCGVKSVTNDAPAAFPLGTTIVTWTVTDTSGNQAAATQKVTVVDSQPPTIAAPAAVTVSADAGQCTASDVTLGTPTTGDNCGVQGVTSNAPTTFSLGATTVTWTVTDTSGNQATATQTVTVVDRTPPTTTASAGGPAGANGWYTGNVRVTLSAADVPACSAVAQTFYRVDGTGANPYAVYSGPFTVTGDGQHTVSFYSTDTAGNSETPKSVAVNIDATPPSLTFGAPYPAPNAAGWNNTSVSIPFTASDATSGVASTNPASPLVLSTEGAFVTGPVTATDVAGNTAGLTSPGVKIDKTPPTTTASLSGQAGANGWYTGNVSVTLTATDALSGVARTIYSLDQAPALTYSGPITIKGDGPHVVLFASTDLAGNPEGTRRVDVKIDSTKPTLTFGTPAPAPNAAGWNNTPVSIPFAASDATSGVASTLPPSSPLVLSTEGKSVSGIVQVTDVAGNMGSFPSPAVKIDLTPPSIMSTQSPQPNANGWNNTAVTITFIASDSLSGVAGSSTKSVTLSQEGAGLKATASFQDVAGNTATGKATANIDWTPPTITCPANVTTTHLPGKKYATVNPGQATATDNLSGVASIVGVRSDGKQLTANYPIGKTTITWTATDKAGNASSCTQTITVN